MRFLLPLHSGVQLELRKKGELLLGGERGKGEYYHYILHFEVQLELTASKRPKTKNRYMHTLSIFSYNDLITTCN